MKYELCKRAGLIVHCLNGGFGTKDYIIAAEKVEAMLEKGQVVYSNQAYLGDGKWCGYAADGTKFKALLVMVEEIPKEPMKVEFEIDVHDSGKFMLPEKMRGKRVKVTVEEVK